MSVEPVTTKSKETFHYRKMAAIWVGCLTGAICLMAVIRGDAESIIGIVFLFMVMLIWPYLIIAFVADRLRASEKACKVLMGLALLQVPLGADVGAGGPIMLVLTQLGFFAAVGVIIAVTGSQRVVASLRAQQAEIDADEGLEEDER